jgi:hypothetical protein
MQKIVLNMPHADSVVLLATPSPTSTSKHRNRAQVLVRDWLHQSDYYFHAILGYSDFKNHHSELVLQRYATLSQSQAKEPAKKNIGSQSCHVAEWSGIVLTFWLSPTLGSARA